MARWSDVTETPQAWMTKERKVIPLDEFIALTRRFEQICRKWIVGAIDDATFLKHYNGEMRKTYAIAEAALDDIESDWSEVLEQVIQTCQEAESYLSNVTLLTLSVRDAILEIQQSYHRPDDSLVRALILGKQAERHQVDMHRFMTPFPIHRLPEEPPPPSM